MTLVMHSPETERRLLGAILRDEAVLDHCADVEPADFFDLNLRFAFEAIRNLQARGEWAHFDAVVSELVRVGHVGVDPARIEATLDMPPYWGERLLVDVDARWLRRLARRRAACG
jgi:hypothetical protein